mgnify:CR=1 FL=1
MWEKNSGTKKKSFFCHKIKKKKKKVFSNFDLQFCHF